MIGKLTRWGLALAVVAWLGSIAVAASARYLELNDVVERVVIDARPAAGIPDPPDAYLRQVQATLAGRAQRPDAPLADDGVRVSVSGGALRVTVRWAQPVVTYNGEAKLSVPLSLTRTFANAL
jgi:hypothetical protein